MRLQSLTDPDTRRISASLMASQMRMGWCLADLEALVSRPQGRVPAFETRGGCDEVDTQKQPLENLVGVDTSEPSTSFQPRFLMRDALEVLRRAPL